MKRYYWLLAAITGIAVGALSVPLNAVAQQAGVSALWANYNVEPHNEFYPASMPNPTTITVDQFLNVVGLPDHDDGVADAIPVGFTFDFNGNSYSAVNVGINGFVTFGPTHTHSYEVGGGGGIPPAGNSYLFSSVEPNNTIAPYWGDHYYRTLEPGYTPSTIRYTTTVGSNGIRTFWLEWQNLNINDKTNPNSIATFMLQIRQNPLANDPAVPDQRATFVFEYGPIGNVGTVQTVGAAVGADDSVGFTHLNALYASLAAPDSVRLNTSTRTTCWPPVAGSTGLSGQTCLPGRDIWIVPQGRGSYAQWGDGDVNLDQIYNTNPKVRANQSLFVTLTDADLILQSIVNNIPLDSIEGHAAFHGDANHVGPINVNNGQSRVFNPNYGAYFYHADEYDAAYIMMYLAGKLAVLPWPAPLPVPGYKESDVHTTDVAAVIADASNARMSGNTVLVPLTLRGRVNGALGMAFDIAGMNSSGVQFAGTRAVDGEIVRANAANGKVALALSGNLQDGATVGYLEFHVTDKQNADFDLTNVMVNDVPLAASHVALKLSGAGAVNSGNVLGQNVPNPFMLASAGYTTIGFDLLNSENVSLRLYDMLGHEVRSLLSDENRAAGHNSIEWDGRDANGNTVASGLYYYQLVTPDFTQTVKMQVVR
ncbi:MAG: FlgD immunoglobulin-like domain containing protein [Bacteroidota bacterium]|nr:FlgD immunoglobulin-like domain containing protein [Bacteroidota bacterium]MDP4232530.1 FlgD immunoglobulin-like domain containing protein [Bacteroidota bacterium]MDP4241665.1 FlgD immunoglobulin-like domain containing protein [Bacteroidota bacterium]MDP4286410.1 FlgD immunoglobulin-like domain containing protein [Bacteroidota bacterium]